ncbi:MAG: DUF4112 domain-containing protein [Xanthobacteraceae bacterium]|nr:DUF4112 domain-containing protein [Xanthobacteraceae bacterium]PWB60348.1 MAG: DUF4112 domain-containing protein [Bradyrhizobiaceae bacterium]
MDRIYEDVEIIPPRAGGRREALERLDRLSRLLDTAIAVPGTSIRLGADAAIGLVPGIGDLVTTLISAYIIREAHRLGAPRHLILRMVGNVALDGLIGTIPLAGDVFDVLWRANRRNVRLLRDHLAREGVTSRLA